MYPYLNSLNPIVAYDVDRYRRRIESYGGTLGDGIISEQEALSRLTGCATGLYAHLGQRCDFLPMREAYQLGYGSKIFSFHGKEMLLENGPEWRVGGVYVAEGQSIKYETLALPANAAKTGYSVFAVIDYGDFNPSAAEGVTGDIRVFSGSNTARNANLYTSTPWGGSPPNRHRYPALTAFQGHPSNPAAGMRYYPDSASMRMRAGINAISWNANTRVLGANESTILAGYISEGVPAGVSNGEVLTMRSYGTAGSLVYGVSFLVYVNFDTPKDIHGIWGIYQSTLGKAA